MRIIQFILVYFFVVGEANEFIMEEGVPVKEHPLGGVIYFTTSLLTALTLLPVMRTK